MIHKKFSAGSAICHVGDDGKLLYLIESGTIELWSPKKKSEIIEPLYQLE